MHRHIAHAQIGPFLEGGVHRGTVRVEGGVGRFKAEAVARLAAGEVEWGGVLVGVRVGMERVRNARLRVEEWGVYAGVGGGDA